MTRTARLVLALAGVAGTGALGVPASAMAASWGEHGLFRVEDGEAAPGVAYCQVRAEADIDGTFFSLVLRWLPSDRLQANFVSGNEGVSEADSVAVAVDKVRMLRFTPMRRDRSEGLNTLVSRTMPRVVGLAVQVMLEHAADGAAWFQVTADPYEDAIPAAGLKEAMQDLRICRASKHL